MMQKIFALTLAVAAVVITASAFTSTAFAQAAKPLGQFRDWGAYVADAKGGKVCYALSQPKSMAPSNVNRDPVHLFVTSRPGQGVKNEVSVVVGYPFKKDSKATAEIKSSKFTLFTKDDGAWVENAAEEARLIAAMRAGATMLIKGTSQRGTNTTDSYSLSGVSAALDRIAKECK